MFTFASGKRILAIGGLVLATTAATLAGFAQPAEASCRPGVDNPCQLVTDYTQANGDRAVFADGVYAQLYAPYGMNVRMRKFPGNAIYRYDTTLPTESGWVVDGHQGRAVQLIDSNDQDAFVGVGVSAGCGQSTTAGNPAQGCTGLNSSNGVLKRQYWDAERCGSINCNYFIGFDKAVDGDTWGTYQIQRNFLSDGPYYRFFADGKNIGAIASTASGYLNEVTVISEREFGFSNASDGSLNMQGAWRGLRYHIYGTASASPPGLTNYGPAPQYTRTGSTFTSNGTGSTACGVTVNPSPNANSGTFRGTC